MDNTVPQTPAKQNDSLWMAVGLVWEIGYIIAIPAFLFGFGGAYLDKYLGVSPLFLLGGLILALLLSGLAVYRRVKQLSSNF